MPLFEDGAYVVYPVPYLAWIRAAKSPNETDLAWQLRQFAHLSIAETTKANLFDALKLWVHWKLGNSPATRTRMRLHLNRTFYHDGPLITRSEVSLERELEELEDPLPLPLKKLSRADGKQLVFLGRDMMTVRYRELHGFTYGDPRHVLRASAGRGVEFVIWGLPPGCRLPLLGYHAFLILKNGVPAGYAKSLALFERTEVGVNLFYTFRDGESAWIYARLLRFLRQQAFRNNSNGLIERGTLLLDLSQQLLLGKTLTHLITRYVAANAVFDALFQRNVIERKGLRESNPIL